MSSFFYGGAACVLAAVVTNPIDVIKVRLQMQGELQSKYTSTAPSKTKPLYRGFLHGLVTILQQEGPSGLYKGLTASLLREASYSTLRMGLYEPIGRAIRSPEDGTLLPLWKKIMAGGISGAIGAAIANPTDLLKVRMQTASHPRRLRDAIESIYNQQGGLVGFYRGVVPTTQRAIILTASQLPAYDHSKQLLHKHNLLQEGYVLHFVCSMFSGLVCATTTSPIDLVKSRMMNQPLSPITHQGLLYASPWDCIRKTVHFEGLFGLYKGWFPNWMRLGPHTIITFLILEQLRKWGGLEPI